MKFKMSIFYHMVVMILFATIFQILSLLVSGDMLKLWPCKLPFFLLETFLLSLWLCVKRISRGEGVKDMSAHSSAPRGHQSPPHSEPEGLTNQPSSAAVAPPPPPPPPVLISSSFRRGEHDKKEKVWGATGVCRITDQTERVRKKGEFLY